MTIYSVPNRASDAGPDERRPKMNRQNIYSLLSDELWDQYDELRKIYRDDPLQESAVRVAKIDELIETLRKMREVA